MRLRHLLGIADPCSTLVLGTADHGTTVARDTAFALLDRFAAAGGTMLDTAHIYAAWVPGGEGASERTIGEWLRSRGLQQRMQIGTKGGHPALTGPRRSRVRPQDILADLAESLERLQVPRVTLYWLHRDDESVPVDELLDALQPHLRAGTIGALGASNWSWQRIAAANACATARGWSGFVASQISWSLAHHAVGHRPLGSTLMMDEPTLAWHASSGVAQIPFSAQAGGLFGKPLDETLRRLPAYDHPLTRARWHAAQAVAARHGVSGNAVALAWLLQHPCGGWAIAAPKTSEQLADTLAGANLQLTDSDHAVLSDPTRRAEEHHG